MRRLDGVNTGHIAACRERERERERGRGRRHTLPFAAFIINPNVLNTSFIWHPHLRHSELCPSVIVGDLGILGFVFVVALFDEDTLA